MTEASPSRAASQSDRMWRRAAHPIVVLAAALALGACAGPMTIPSDVFGEVEPDTAAAEAAAEEPDTVADADAGDAADTADAADAADTADAAEATDTTEAEEEEGVVGATPAGITVLTGIDVLAREGAGPLTGARVGLITNHTGRTVDGESSIDVIHALPQAELVALFAPEHGIRGVADAGEQVRDGRDTRTGVPIYSLYGETRAPTAEMLEDVDALAFDIQDIGTRYYTYVWTMALAMEAAAEHDRRFVVLDRPNPIGGTQVQGNLLDPEYATFVGLYPVPMRHGLTAGELARYLNAEFDIGADLEVVAARGWQRSLWYDDTGLPWTPPSPNMPSLESATHYPGTCLFEGTNLSVGRGTDRAFQQIGASWLDAEAVTTALGAAFGDSDSSDSDDSSDPGAASELAARGDSGIEFASGPLAGVRIEAVRFTPENPGDRKFAGESVQGLRLTVTDREVYDPTRTAIALLIEIHRLHNDRLEWRVAHFDRLAGSDRVREAIVAGADLEEATRGWSADENTFEEARQEYLIYP